MHIPSWTNDTLRRELVSDSASRRHTARMDLDAMQGRLDQMHLVLQTLLTLLAEKKVIEEQEFREWMRYVDELDGKLDGRVADEKAPQICGSCGRKSAFGAVKCQYCGSAFEARVFARGEQSKHGQQAQGPDVESSEAPAAEEPPSAPRDASATPWPPND